MTVIELIRELADCDPNQEVEIHVYQTNEDFVVHKVTQQIATDGVTTIYVQ